MNKCINGIPYITFSYVDRGITTMFDCSSIPRSTMPNIYVSVLKRNKHICNLLYTVL